MKVPRRLPRKPLQPAPKEGRCQICILLDHHNPVERLATQKGGRSWPTPHKKLLVRAPHNPVLKRRSRFAESLLVPLWIRKIFGAIQNEANRPTHLARTGRSSKLLRGATS